VIKLRGISKATCIALLCISCAFTAGCADAVSAAAHAVVHVAADKSAKRFCAYEISVPTTANDAAINRYWTPLARSAIEIVSEGKMAVPVPRKHLSLAQRRALRLAEWAERALAPKPRLVCLILPHSVRPKAGTNAPD
jgi:hypothetical protein